MDIGGFIASLLSGQDLIIRLALVVLTALYGLFALILAIQISNFNKVVNQIGFSSVLNFVAIAHFLGALALILLTVVSL